MTHSLAVGLVVVTVPLAALGDDVTIEAMPEISFQENAALSGHGFRTSVDLRRRAVPLDDKAKNALAKTLAVSRARLDEILGWAEVMGWKGVTADMAVHLGRCGAGSWELLAMAEPAAVRSCLWRRITASESEPPGPDETSQGRVPSLAQIEEWAKEARAAGFKVMKSTDERAIDLDLLPGLSLAARAAATKEKWATNLDAASDLGTGGKRVAFQKKRKLSDDDLATLYAMVDLTRMGELDPDLALLMVRAGVSSLQHLSGTSAADLLMKMTRRNGEERIVGSLPDTPALQALIDRAKDFPKAR